MMNGGHNNVQGNPGRTEPIKVEMEEETTKSPEETKDLEEFLTFDSGKGPTVIEKVEEENDDETFMDVDFEMDGQKVSARISSAMVEVLQEDEALRQQLVEKLLAEGDCKEPVFITSERPKPESHPTPQASSKSNTPTNYRTRHSTGTVLLNNSVSRLVEKDGVSPVSKPMRPLPVSRPTRPLADLNATKTMRPLPHSSNSKSLRPQQSASTVRKLPQFNGARNVANSVNKVAPATKVGSDTSPVPKPVGMSDDRVPNRELIWSRDSIKTLIECYREVTTSLNAVKAEERVWKIVTKKMEKKGCPYPLEACEKKFIALSKAYNARMRHQISTGISVPWIYGQQMEGLLLQEEECPKTPHKNGRVDDEDDLSSTCSTSSDDEDYGKVDDNDEIPTKKLKTGLEDITGIELFRRTYLKLETKKLKELRETRKLHKRQVALQAERNELLRNIAELMKKPE